LDLILVLWQDSPFPTIKLFNDFLMHLQIFTFFICDNPQKNLKKIHNS